jgi:hypothetical protein
MAIINTGLVIWSIVECVFIKSAKPGLPTKFGTIFYATFWLLIIFSFSSNSAGDL